MEKIWKFSENKEQSKELIDVFELFKKYADRVEIDTNGEYKGIVEYKNEKIIFSISDKLNYKEVGLYEFPYEDIGDNNWTLIVRRNYSTLIPVWNLEAIDEYLNRSINSKETNEFLQKEFSRINLKKQTISELAVEMIYQMTGETVSEKDRDELQGDANYQIAMYYLKKAREI